MIPTTATTALTTEMFEHVAIAERMCQEGYISENIVGECWSLLDWARAKAKGPGGFKFAINKMRELTGPDPLEVE